MPQMRTQATAMIFSFLALAAVPAATYAGTVCPCLGDITGNGVVDGADLGELLAAWGACGKCAADLSGNGTVDGSDLGILLASWGPCDDIIANDACADATNVVGLTGSANPFCTIGASTDGPAVPNDCSVPSIDAIESDVWFRLVAPTTATYQFGVCADFDVRMAVYTSPSWSNGNCSCTAVGGPLVAGACAGTAAYPTCSQGAVVLMPAEAGQCILVRIGGGAGQQGTGNLDINIYVPPCDIEPSSTLSSSGIEADSEFGLSVDIRGDRAVVAAFYDDILFGPANAGSVRVFGWNGSGWTAAQTLLSPAPFTQERFGLHTAIAGDWIIVGAGAVSAQCETDPNCDSGAAHVYRYNGVSWVFDQKLVPTGGTAEDGFGVRVDIDGNRAIVGASNDTNANGASAGAAYLYGYTAALGGVWLQSTKVIAPGGMAGDNFGSDVAVSGNWALIGADNVDGVGGANTGRAYMYKNEPGGWAFFAALAPSSLVASSRFGRALAIDGAVAAIGAPENSSNPGTVYVYENFGDAGWLLAGTLRAHDGANGDRFGSTVSVSGNQVMVGASGANAGRGSAYVFWRVNGGWVERAKLTDPNGVAGDAFGTVAISEGRGLVGAYLNDVGLLTDVGSVHAFNGLGDCTGNGVADACDIGSGMPDSDGDGIPDVCEP